MSITRTDDDAAAKKAAEDKKKAQEEQLALEIKEAEKRRINSPEGRIQEFTIRERQRYRESLDLKDWFPCGKADSSSEGGTLASNPNPKVNLSDIVGKHERKDYAGGHSFANITLGDAPGTVNISVQKGDIPPANPLEWNQKKWDKHITDKTEAEVDALHYLGFTKVTITFPKNPYFESGENGGPRTLMYDVMRTEVALSQSNKLGMEFDVERPQFDEMLKKLEEMGVSGKNRADAIRQGMLENQKGLSERQAMRDMAVLMEDIPNQQEKIEKAGDLDQKVKDEISKDAIDKTKNPDRDIKSSVDVLEKTLASITDRSSYTDPQKQQLNKFELEVVDLKKEMNAGGLTDADRNQLKTQINALIDDMKQLANESFSFKQKAEPAINDAEQILSGDKAKNEAKAAAVNHIEERVKAVEKLKEDYVKALDLCQKVINEPDKYVDSKGALNEEAKVMDSAEKNQLKLLQQENGLQKVIAKEKDEIGKACDSAGLTPKEKDQVLAKVEEAKKALAEKKDAVVNPGKPSSTVAPAGP